MQRAQPEGAGSVLFRSKSSGAQPSPTCSSPICELSARAGAALPGRKCLHTGRALSPSRRVPGCAGRAGLLHFLSKCCCFALNLQGGWREPCLCARSSARHSPVALPKPASVPSRRFPFLLGERKMRKKKTNHNLQDLRSAHGEPVVDFGAQPGPGLGLFPSLHETSLWISPRGCSRRRCHRRVTSPGARPPQGAGQGGSGAPGEHPHPVLGSKLASGLAIKTSPPAGFSWSSPASPVPRSLRPAPLGPR